MMFFPYVIAVVVVLWTVEGRYDCDCHRARVPYFFTSHPPGWVMLLRAVLTSTIAVWSILGRPDDFVTAPLWLAFVAFTWRRWWLHEKDKVKRAARSSARVVVDGFGRLRVSPA